MTDIENTYTYTARSADDPASVVTFTLLNGHMRVNLTDVMEQVAVVAGAQEKPEEIKRQLSTQTKPIFTKALENYLGPVHIHDVDAKLKNDRLKVILWQRISGLRLAPVIFKLGKIDNEDAAEAFVDEVNQRKTKTSLGRKFSGPLDYWAGWAGILILAGGLLRWMVKRNNAQLKGRKT